jgi:formylglycine-generating enzyme required for sulfatase activity
MKLVRIPAGKFVMGSRERQNDPPDDLTRHEVTISKPFYMGVYEVTQTQWRAVMASNPSKFRGDNRPVEMVSWDDCQSFCKKLSAKVGRTVRLPTEAEWEYACRAGTKTAYYFGDDESQLAQYAWCAPHGFQYDWVSGTERRSTHDVGGKIPNAWGLYDMHGNVWEWCQDWYGVYSADSQTDPTGLSNGRNRVRRGGGCYNGAFLCRAAYRADGWPATPRASGVGSSTSRR